MSAHDRGPRLLQLRKRLGKTQAEMAALAGVVIACYQRYERGERDIRPKYVERLRNSCGANPIWVYDGKGEMFLDSRDPWAASAPSHEAERIASTVRYVLGRELSVEEMVRLAKALNGEAAR